MKKLRLLIVLALVFCLSFSMFAACGRSESVNNSSEETPPATNNTNTQENNEQTDTASGETAEIQIMLQDLRGVGAKAQPVIDEMNKITEETIGVRIDVTWVDTANYPTQVGLAISGNEPYDLIMINPIEGSNFTTLSANRQLMDITELLDQYASETMELVSKYVGAYTIEGSIYGVPAYRNYSSSVYLIMRKDILEQINMLEKAENLKTWSEVEEIFAAVAEQTDLSPIAANGMSVAYTGGAIFDSDEFAETTVFDNLSDVLNVVYVDENDKVQLLPETEEFRTVMERVKKWYDNGWVYKDSIMTQDHVDTLTKAGVNFASIQVSELGVETSKKEATGYDMVCVELTPNMLSSGFVNKFGMGVPITADDPEAAVKWLNELYTDPRLSNLLAWGVEGEDYVLVDGEADYPEGVDAESVRYHTADFLYGNYFNMHPWKGSGADFRQRALEALESAPISPYLGFSPDFSELNNIIAALTSVQEEYKGIIYCGAWTDADYDKYIDTLKAAGVEEYLAEIQRQLDEWIAKNK